MAYESGICVSMAWGSSKTSVAQGRLMVLRRMHVLICLKHEHNGPLFERYGLSEKSVCHFNLICKHWRVSLHTIQQLVLTEL